MNLGKNVYKIKDNLYIKGNKVISYETIVAEIKGNELIENGRYTRTTSKHIHLISRILDLNIVPSKVKMKDSFYKHDYGVKCNSNFKTVIGAKASRVIFEKIKEGCSYEIAVAMSKSSIPKKDWEALDKKGISEDLIKGGSALGRILF